MVRLGDVASTVRSKNAGPDCITFDIIFRDAQIYERVKASGALSPERICQLYGLEPERLVHFGAFDPAGPSSLRSAGRARRAVRGKPM